MKFKNLNSVMHQQPLVVGASVFAWVFPVLAIRNDYPHKRLPKYLFNLQTTAHCSSVRFLLAFQQFYQPN